MSFKKVAIYSTLTTTLALGLLVLTLERFPEVIKNQTGIVSFYNLITNELLFEPLRTEFGSIFKSSRIHELELSKIHKKTKNSERLNTNELYTLIKSDFVNLKANFDKRLFKIKNVNWHIRDEEFEKDYLEKAIGLHEDLYSNIALEIEVFSQTDQREKLTIIQLSYTDLTSGNKIHEFSRMYQHGKKKPD